MLALSAFLGNHPIAVLIVVAACLAWLVRRFVRSLPFMPVFLGILVILFVVCQFLATNALTKPALWKGSLFAFSFLPTWWVVHRKKNVSGLFLAVPVFIGSFAFAMFVSFVVAYLRSPPLGSPPIWAENRKKYERIVGNTPRFDNIPVDLWFGHQDGRYDTTHFRIASDYALTPVWHGESVQLNIVWPSLRSVDEENEVREANGQKRVLITEIFFVYLHEADNGWGSSPRSEHPPSECSPMVFDKERGVRYCKEFRSKHVRINYWPLDDSMRAPYFNDPVNFGCYIDYHPVGGMRPGCYSYIRYSRDILLHVVATEEITVELLANFPKLIRFLQSLEVHHESDPEH